VSRLPGITAPVDLTIFDESLEPPRVICFDRFFQLVLLLLVEQRPTAELHVLQGFNGQAYQDIYYVVLANTTFNSVVIAFK
jgi:hypothetical protein